MRIQLPSVLRRARPAGFALLTAFVAACAMRSGPATRDSEAVALQFARALARHDYAGALAMTSRSYRTQTGVDGLRRQYENMVPPALGPATVVQVMQTLEHWSDKKAADVTWVYVAIAGDEFSEAVTVVTTREDGGLRVRPLEFGRP